MEPKIISVFEHEKLCVGEKGFSAANFNALTKFNDTHGGRYFRVGFNNVTFGAYVGVIQVGTHTIEVLPKADAKRDDLVSRNKWQKALLAMLCKAGFAKLNQTNKALQNSTSRHLLDVYLFSFLSEVQSIVQMGFIKKYRQISTNSKVFKGRLLIGQHLQNNLIHKERFFTQHSVYDANHTLNSVIKKAVRIVILVTNNQFLKIEFSKVMLHFEHIDVWEGNVSLLDNIALNRKSKHYAESLDLAVLLIKNFSPDFSAGRENILSILFNMNALFERFVIKSLREVAWEFAAYSLQVFGKREKLLWKHKKIIPDIVVTFEKEGIKHMLIIDAKWKNIGQDDPSDEDLRQVYTYNLQFGSTKALLLYPMTNQKNLGPGVFQPLAHELIHEHSCELHFVDIFEKDIVSSRFAVSLFKRQIGIS